MELGLGWWEGPRSPFRFKAGMGRFEHRLAMDMAGYGAGAPGLALESKLALVEGKHGALAPILMTTIPMAGEIWRGQLGMLGLLESSGVWRCGVTSRSSSMAMVTSCCRWLFWWTCR